MRNEPAALLPAFVDGARELVEHGAVCITMSCGFLTLIQDKLARALPVLISSLFQVAAVARLLLPARRVRVLTIARSALSARYLAAAGVPEGTPIETN